MKNPKWRGTKLEQSDEVGFPNGGTARWTRTRNYIGSRQLILSFWALSKCFLFSPNSRFPEGFWILSPWCEVTLLRQTVGWVEMSELRTNKERFSEWVMELPTGESGSWWKCLVDTACSRRIAENAQAWKKINQRLTVNKATVWWVISLFPLICSVQSCALCTTRNAHWNTAVHFSLPLLFGCKLKPFKATCCLCEQWGWLCLCYH